MLQAFSWDNNSRISEIKKAPPFEGQGGFINF